MEAHVEGRVEAHVEGRVEAHVEWRMEALVEGRMEAHRGCRGGNNALLWLIPVAGRHLSAGPLGGARRRRASTDVPHRGRRYSQSPRSPSPDASPSLSSPENRCATHRPIVNLFRPPCVSKAGHGGGIGLRRGGGGGSTAPAHQRLGPANAETTPTRAPAAAADRKQRPDATCGGKTG